MIMAAAVYPGLVAYAGMNYAVLRKELGVYGLAVTAGTLVMAALAWLMVPQWQAAGAAWATVAGYAAMAAVFGIRYRREFAEVLRGFRWTVLLAVPFAPLCFHPQAVWTAAAICCCAGVFYAAILVAFRIVRWDELRGFARAFRNTGK
jgi:O-antigen/teichoic acid export membrane protein